MSRASFSPSPAIVAAFLSAVLLGSPACGAGGEHPASSGATHEAAPVGNSAEKGATPSTPTGIWAEITSRRDAIVGLIQNGQLKGIHAQSEGLEGLGNRLVKSSSMLDEAKLARVRGAVKQMALVADSLHDAADKGDAPGAVAEFQKLEMLLKLIEAQYPDGALSSGMPQGRNAGPDGAGAAVAQDPHAHHHHADEAADASIPSDAQRVSIRANDFSFTPREVTVKAGRPVAITVTNGGTSEHDWVIAAKPDIHIHVLPGQSETQVFTFDRPGQYPVICTLPGHKQLGMVGKIVIM